MALAEDPLLFLFRRTPSDDLVGALFEQKWLIPIIGMNFVQEVFLVMCFPIN